MPTLTREQSDLLAYIFDHTYQTGTVAYQVPNPKDHDRFCTEQTLLGIIQMITMAGLPLSGQDNYLGTKRSITLSLGGDLFNIFQVPDDEIGILKLVTQTVKEACQLYPEAGKQKPIRVHLFRTLRDTLGLWKDMTPPLVTEPPHR